MLAMKPTKDIDVWRLPANVRVAAVDDDLVFLDINADAYSCLPGGAAVAAICAGGRTLRLGDQLWAEQLSAAGLAPSHHEPEHDLDALRWPPPTMSALQDQAARPQWRDVPQALGCLADLLAHYRARSFAEIVWTASSSAPKGAPKSSDDMPSADLLALVGRFHRWSPYLPVTGKCLLQSFMLLRLLHRSGHDAAWVFGVSTWPFRAHCWLQCGEVVLNDTFERVRTYQPIMVV